MLASVRPRDVAGKTRQRIAAEELAELIAVEAKIKKATAELKTLVLARGSHLMDLHGVGPVVAARVLADVGDGTRFADRNRFASWTGTAPLDASSGEQNRHPFIPDAGRLFLAFTVWTDFTKAEVEANAAARREAKAARGPATEYETETFTHGPEDTPWQLGDVVIQVLEDDGDLAIYPPAVVITEPRPVRGSRGSHLQLLRHKIDMSAYGSAAPTGGSLAESSVSSCALPMQL